MKSNLRCDSKRAKMSKSLNEKHAIIPQIDKTVPQNQKNPKDSNGPCNLGPKQDKANIRMKQRTNTQIMQ